MRERQSVKLSYSGIFDFENFSVFWESSKMGKKAIFLAHFFPFLAYNTSLVYYGIV